MKFVVTNKVTADKYGYPHNKEITVAEKENRQFMDSLVEAGHAKYVVAPAPEVKPVAKVEPEAK